MFQLGYPSSAVKNPDYPSLKDDLKQILSATRPEVVYTHNPAEDSGKFLTLTSGNVQYSSPPENARPAGLTSIVSTH